MADTSVKFPWGSYYRNGLITRRQFVKLTALLGGTAAAGSRILSAPAPASAALAPAAKQVLRYPSQEPLHFDPATMETRREILVGMALFDPLITFDDTGHIVAVAARAWEVSKDGLTYTFHLRPGMRWSDGHPVTAADFEYAWKRVADPAIASDYASALYPIKGALDYNKGTTKTSAGVAIKAADTLTLRVTLTEPAAYFPRLVSTWNYLPVPRWQVEKYGKKWVEPGNHVGNGMFTLQKWEHDRELVIVANPHYWGAKPTLQRIVFTLTDDAFRTSLPAFENNELDVTDQIQPGDIERVRKDPTLSKQLQKYRWSGTAAVFCDTTNTKSPLSKSKVRQALYLAIDHKRVASDVLRGIYDPAPTITPPGTIGYLATPPLTGGADRARQLLAEAGYPDGKGFPDVKLAWGKLVTFDLVAQALQQMWQDTLKINITLQRMEAKEYNAAFNSWAKQPYDCFIDRWGSDYEDPANWANILFDSEQDFFHTKWRNDAFDKLIRKGAGEGNPAARKQMYEAAEKILNTDLPAIPIFHLGVIVAVKPWVQGFRLPPAATAWYGTFGRVKILDH
ncbi:MAG TPA: peptide ABC transporter substrate-binding protein [bacterium]|nr:peptide ABC transporter substrate-binding protein [bacterium]